MDAERRGRSAVELLRRRRQVDVGIRELLGLNTTDGLLDRVCRVASDYCEFDRVMLSRVERHTWWPWRSYAQAPGEPEFRFAHWVHTAPRFKLSVPQVAIVSGSTAAMVTTATRQFPIDLVAAMSLTHYVMAPLIAGERLVGYLHADRTDQLVGPDDLEVLAAFAGQLGHLLGQAQLVDQLSAHCDRLRVLADSVDTLVYGNQAESPDFRGTPFARNPLRPRDRLAELTRRERGVLVLLATGAANARIAAELVVTPETVKSHVKNILRKLEVVNRSEAAAFYLRSTIGV